VVRIFRSTPSKRAVDREHGRSLIVCERTHERCMLTKGELHVVRGTIAEAKPNDLRRRAAQDRQLLEVGVLSHNHSTGRACESPNTLVGRLGELVVAHMLDVEEVGERDRETRIQF